jgi:hypothetical protein
MTATSTTTDAEIRELGRRSRCCHRAGRSHRLAVRRRRCYLAGSRHVGLAGALGLAAEEQSSLVRAVADPPREPPLPANRRARAR